ncbi:MAG: hypothetical protein IKC38_05995 [Clostridia bacterium]|nr:hypothetical protein [Clostridia bacterium]
MSHVVSKIRYFVFGLAAILVMVVGLVFVHATAATYIYDVTNAITGEQLYRGNDIQEAFDAAERGSIISIGRNVTIKTNVIIDAEVMISNYSLIRFADDGKFLLTGDGALYVDTRLPVKRIGALYSYSSIDYTDTEGPGGGSGYLYFLVTQPPSLEGNVPQISAGEGLFGSHIDDTAGVIYLDASVDGISIHDLTGLISMEASNADDVTFTVNGSVYVNGKDCVKNGSTIIASANNRDTKTTATRTYNIVLVGDVNGNGRIDAADASLIVRASDGKVSLSDLAIAAADADRDGSVSAADADVICKKYVRVGSYKSPLGGQ